MGLHRGGGLIEKRWTLLARKRPVRQATQGLNVTLTLANLGSGEGEGEGELRRRSPPPTRHAPRQRPRLEWDLWSCWGRGLQIHLKLAIVSDVRFLGFFDNSAVLAVYRSSVLGCHSRYHGEVLGRSLG